MKNQIKVLVADDSVLMRVMIKDVLQKDTSISVIAQAKDGKEAAEMCSKYKPDVVIMDITMGQYDGIYGVKAIMENCPTPILILSAMGNTDLEPIMQALKEGAVDYLNKPEKSNMQLFDSADELAQKVKEVALSEVHLVKNVSTTVNVNQHTFDDQLPYDVIVIGSSTGGPTAVEKIISMLPGNLTVPVIIAQHMPANFVPSFAERLNKITPLKVSLALKDDKVEKGKILIAPGSRNMVLKNQNNQVVVDFTSQRYKEFNFPSVTGLMLSVAEIYGSRAIGVILTGMGRDGTEGMKAIQQAGGYTIAQSPETCVVYGMPKAAIEAGCVKQIVPIHEIGMFLVSCLS